MKNLVNSLLLLKVIAAAHASKFGRSSLDLPDTAVAFTRRNDGEVLQFTTTLITTLEEANTFQVNDDNGMHYKRTVASMAKVDIEDVRIGSVTVGAHSYFTTLALPTTVMNVSAPNATEKILKAGLRQALLPMQVQEISFHHSTGENSTKPSGDQGMHNSVVGGGMAVVFVLLLVCGARQRIPFVPSARAVGGPATLQASMVYENSPELQIAVTPTPSAPPPPVIGMLMTAVVSEAGAAKFGDTEEQEGAEEKNEGDAEGAEGAEEKNEENGREPSEACKRVPAESYEISIATGEEEGHEEQIPVTSEKPEDLQQLHPGVNGITVEEVV